MTFGFIVTDTFIPCALDAIMENPGVTGSHHIKHLVYEKTFGIKFRHKYTGFEYIQDLDAEYREKFKKILQTDNLTESVTTTVPQSIKESIGQMCGVTVVPTQENNTLIKEQENTLPVAHEEYVLDSTPEENIERYRNFLINRAKQYANDATPPIVYYSGGGDSEMVVQSFLAAQVPFYAVCFLLVCDTARMDIDSMMQAHSDNNQVRNKIPDSIFEMIEPGEICLNLLELSNAFDSSKQYGFGVIVRIINVINVWESKELLDRLKHDHITSPMILTQRIMTEIINQEISMFGDKYIKGHAALRVEL